MIIKKFTKYILLVALLVTGFIACDDSGSGVSNSGSGNSVEQLEIAGTWSWDDIKSEKHIFSNNEYQHKYYDRYYGDMHKKYKIVDFNNTKRVIVYQLENNAYKVLKWEKSYSNDKTIVSAKFYFSQSELLSKPKMDSIEFTGFNDRPIFVSKDK